MHTYLPYARRFGMPALVLVLTAVGVADAWQHPYSWDGLDKGPDWLVRSVPLLLGLPLLARPLFSFAAPAVAFGAAAAASFVSAEAVVDTSGNFVLLLLASMLIGLNPRKVAAAGLALAIATVAIVDANALTFTWGDFFFPSIFFTLTWLLGHLWYERGERARTTGERLAALERSQAETARLAAQEERERIARELHDVIAHSVSVMTVQAGAVRRRLQPEQEREREALVAVEETGRQALSEMRRLLGILRRDDEQAELEPQPGLRTLSELVEQVREAGLPVELRVEGDRVDLPPGVDLSAYRIVQEALTNTLKHAGPARAWVAVRYGEDEVEVEVANDGRSEANGDGQGLVGMRERVALCGGALEAGPRVGGGYAISARLPVAGGAS
ncbi:MAG TPA: sensor histidine kinase [Gaiellaceae bacterium]|nr:sensor histidine kinase [Gaiellaceae bacterium]